MALDPGHHWRRTRKKSTTAERIDLFIVGGWR
jgi:hypothetical protein